MDRKSFLTTLGFGVMGFVGSLFGSIKFNSRNSEEICGPSDPSVATNFGVVTTPTVSDDYQNSIGAGGSLRGTNTYGSMAHPPFFI